MKSIRHFTFVFAFLMFVLGAAAIASAQDGTPDDKDDSFSGTVNFIQPLVIVPDATYEFSFEVKNTTSETSTKRWIDTVEMFMPSPEYQIDHSNLSSPDPVHGEGSWEVGTQQDLDGTWGILWMYFGGSSSTGYGDIREGETLDFSFNATTDAGATDGFKWSLVADNDEMVTGTAYIGSADDDGNDDDASGDDAGDDTGDDFPSPDDDQDGLGAASSGDENKSGCGC